MCGIVAPPGTGLQGFSASNRLMAPDAWHDSRPKSIPRGLFVGEIALFQLHHKRQFPLENTQSQAAPSTCVDI
eukprot:4481482-Prorocentrum_lima.AAC.1